MTANYQTPTKETYDALERAFQHFNAALFDNRLPPVMFTLNSKRNARGYFWAEQFKHREDGDRTHEIALNPEYMGRTVKEILSTLVHEMTHLEQQEYGKPGRKGYHNREWVSLMERVGLIPSDTGEPGGKQTGTRVTHYWEEDGSSDFAIEADKLLLTGFDLPWFVEAAEAAAKKPKKKDTSKVKFTCPCCQFNAWAKQDANLMCGDCREVMEASDE